MTKNFSPPITVQNKWFVAYLWRTCLDKLGKFEQKMICLVYRFGFIFEFSRIFYDFVSNKAKGRISKRVYQENIASQIFRKTNISYPLIRR